MKKTLIAITIFLFAATVISYAGIYKEQSNNPSSSSIYGSNNSTENNDSGNSGGLFRNSTADDPGGRPGNGGGIGQESPVGDGLPILILCSLILFVVKYRNNKKRDKSNNENDEDSNLTQ